MDEIFKQLTTSFGLAGIVIALEAFVIAKLWNAYREEATKNGSLLERLLTMTNNHTEALRANNAVLDQIKEMAAKTLEGLNRRRS